MDRWTRSVAASGGTVTQISPLTGRPMAQVPQSTPEDVMAAFDRARTAQAAWAAVPVRDRADRLLAFHDLVMRHRTELVEVVVAETGKTPVEAFEEVFEVAATARYYGILAPRYLAEYRVRGLVPVLTRVTVAAQPLGVVGIISPWNYPFFLSMGDGLAALVAGNAVVVKPASLTVRSAAYGADLLAAVGIPPDLWQVVAGPGERVGNQVIELADGLCFTGAISTGRRIAGRAGERLLPATFELGGKNPMIVLDDADPDRAAAGAVRSCYPSAGQLCVSTERLYVADALYGEFRDRLVDRIRRLRLRPGMHWDSDFGTLISQQQLDRVVAHVDDARAGGARVLVGGRARPDLAPFMYEPTVLEGVSPSMRCYGEETFGPVVSLYRFGDVDEAIALANGGQEGLSASVYGRDVRRATAVGRRIRCGMVNINEGWRATFGSIDAPMGGMRDSGLGYRNGREGLVRFTALQSVAAQRALPLAPLAGQGARAYARMFSAVEWGLRRIRRP